MSLLYIKIYFRFRITSLLVYHISPRESGKIHKIKSSADSKLTCHPWNFPTVRTRKAIYIYVYIYETNECARASQRGALRRVELKERRPLKKLVLSFPLVDSGPHLARRSEVLYEPEERPSIESWISPARRRVLTKINRRLAWTITVCLAAKTNAWNLRLVLLGLTPSAKNLFEISLCHIIPWEKDYARTFVALPISIRIYKQAAPTQSRLINSVVSNFPAPF